MHIKAAEVTVTTACVSCGKPAIKSKGNDVIQYGAGRWSTTITCVVDFIYCANCDLRYTDCRAEKIRENAITTSWKCKIIRTGNWIWNKFKR